MTVALRLEFPPSETVVLARANNVDLCYELTHESRGRWFLAIVTNNARRERLFTNDRKARQFARQDFRRRQLIALANPT